ncbi:MAG TPA: hypothetical protein VKV27_16495 [Solirubrobacteraceae bacterium]|nr:hypothetical protein [Solirubrobacteraceae bacterium]
MHVLFVAIVISALLLVGVVVALRRRRQRIGRLYLIPDQAEIQAELRRARLNAIRLERGRLLVDAEVYDALARVTAVPKRHIEAYVFELDPMRGTDAELAEVRARLRNDMIDAEVGLGRRLGSRPPGQRADVGVIIGSREEVLRAVRSIRR